MKLLTLTVILATASVAGFGTHQAPPPVRTFAQEVRADALTQTVRVMSASGRGTGVVVARRDGRCTILTAAHVVTGGTTFAIDQHLPGRIKTAVAKLVKIDVKMDLATLDAPDIFGEPVRIVTRKEIESLAPYDAVLSVGYPLGMKFPTVTEGRLQVLDHDGYLRISAPMVPGNSGGGIYAKIGDKWVMVSICQKVFLTNGQWVPHLGLGCLPTAMLDFLGG